MEMAKWSCNQVPEWRNMAHSLPQSRIKFRSSFCIPDLLFFHTQLQLPLLTLSLHTLSSRTLHHLPSLSLQLESRLLRLCQHWPLVPLQSYTSLAQARRGIPAQMTLKQESVICHSGAFRKSARSCATRSAITDDCIKQLPCSIDGDREARAPNIIITFSWKSEVVHSLHQ